MGGRMAQPPLSPPAFYHKAEPQAPINITVPRADLVFFLVTLAGLALTASLLVFVPVAGFILLGLQLLTTLLVGLRCLLICRFKRGMK